MAVTARPAQRSFPVVTSRPTVASAWLILTIVAAVFLLALGLRLWGLTWGLPWVFHPDEVNYVGPAQRMLRSGDPNPRYFENPSLLTYVLAGELLTARALGALGVPTPPEATNAEYLLARLNSAILGSASVVLVFAIGARLFNRWVGVVAALLLSVSFLHVRDSHYGVNDVPGTALLLVSLYGSARLLRQPTLRWYLLAGFGGGLATSAKYNMGFFLLPLVVAHLLGAGERLEWHRQPACAPRASGRHRDGSIALALAAVASVVGFLLGTPYTLLDFERFWHDFLTQYRFGESRWLGQPLEPVPLLYVTTLLQGFGAVPLGLALVGLALVWRRRAAEGAVVLAFPIVYLLFLLPKPLFFPRLAVPLLPFCSLLAAYGASELVGRLTPNWRFAATCALLTLAVAQPLANDLRHNQLLLEKDTRVLANEWIQANLQPGSRIKAESYSLLDRSADGRTYTPNTSGLRIEAYLSSPDEQQLRYFRDQDVDYFVTSSFHFERLSLDPPRRQGTARAYQRFRRELEERSQLVAGFSPGSGGRELTYRGDDVMTPLWDLHEYERTGPTIRIYSLGS
jgi:4-amino-4-deoxy-L-arabinose transferase-like glycosyltransferase